MRESGARARSLYAQCTYMCVCVICVCYACAATCDSGIFHVLPSIEELICLLNVVEGASFFHRRINFQTREKSLTSPISTVFFYFLFVQFIKIFEFSAVK